MFVTDAKRNRKEADEVQTIAKGEIETRVLQYAEFDGRDAYTTSSIDLVTGKDPTAPGSRLRPGTEMDVVNSIWEANHWIANRVRQTADR
jgi:hypothetical protein